MVNGSLDFLDMIKNGAGSRAAVRKNRQEEKQTGQPENKPENKSEVRKVPANKMVAVIDTETNWHDEVMTIGVALADQGTLQCVDRRYYILEPECRVGGMYSGVIGKCEDRPITGMRDQVLCEIRKHLDTSGVSKIFAYNGKFDVMHLPELSGYEWYDIMRLAAYRQFNKSIPPTAECCKTGRLKRNYGVEPIMRMLTGNSSYFEVHNAVMDAVDELKIMELLGHGIEAYECARI